MIFWITRLVFLIVILDGGVIALALKWMDLDSAVMIILLLNALILLGLWYHFRLIQQWRIEGEYQKAAKHFRAWWFFLPPNQYYLLLIGIQIGAEDFEAAEAAIKNCESKKLCPVFIIESLRGGLEQKRKRLPAAEWHYQKAIKAAKTENQKATSMMDLASLYIDRWYHQPEKLEAARQLISNSAAILKTKPGIAPLVQGIEAALDVRMGNFAQAVTVFREIIPKTKSMTSKFPLALGFMADQLYYAGMAEKALGNINEARAAWEYGLSLTKCREINELISTELKNL